MIRTAMSAVFLALLSLPALGAEPERPPNFVVVLADDKY